ncbi:MAG: hypothetical protein RID81_06855 [Sandaracinaceae bacterium]
MAAAVQVDPRAVAAEKIRQLHEDLDALECRALAARLAELGVDDVSPSIVAGEVFVLLEGPGCDGVGGHGVDFIAAVRDALRDLERIGGAL